MASEQDRSIRIARLVFTIAGIYGIFVLVPQYFMENKIGRDFPPAITHPEQFYGFIGVALVWQILFLMIGRDPVRFRSAMIPSILEKLAFSLPCILLFIQGRLSPAILAVGSVDLILAVLFLISFRVTPKGE
jgi:hypothetical protein